MKTMKLRVAALKPRNVFARFAKTRKAGVHGADKQGRSEEHKDMLRRLREAGL